MPGARADPGVVVGADGLARCWWCDGDATYRDYHDREWGVEVHDDVRLFEKLCLEGFQAGLSWLTILRKRPRFREVFAGFDPAAVAALGADDVDRLLTDPGIVRNRAKVEATVANARAYHDLVAREGSLDAYVWRFAPVAPPVPRTRQDVRASSPESAAMSRDLKQRGWRFVGPTTVYAFQQAMGLVDDHLVGCWRRGATKL
ncbi:DNA-3-methyladenine glycosylase I [Egicoccus halophilus]|uniref:DNA-3-methyladenine glycosylase I n=1 Tax=Egicoccus halophilus TaxID=1670830 RepID=UPI00166880B3